MSALFIRGPKIYTEAGIIENGFLSIVGKRINTVSVLDGERFTLSDKGFIFPENYAVIPGRIDLHTHGLAGVDVMDATSEALHIMTQKLVEEGTTSFLATTMSMPAADIAAAIKNVATFIKNEKNLGARILGLHLEGPFIAPQKMGAHHAECLLRPDVNLMREWQSIAEGAIKLVTLAPELDGAAALIECLLGLDIIPAIGHSNASCETALTAIENGCRHITHLFNAMSGLHHRHPGVALAALESHVLAEIIADGEHVSWEVLKFVMRIKGQHELCVVTDSMRAKCMPTGDYDLGGQKVIVTRDSARLEDGTLAGSILSMEQAIKNLIQHHICDLNQAIFLSSINPAKQLGIFDEVGSLASGKYADIVVLDEEHNVVLTLCHGEIVYKSSKEKHLNARL